MVGIENEIDNDPDFLNRFGKRKNKLKEIQMNDKTDNASVTLRIY
jgi:hypothetical protein